MGHTYISSLFHVVFTTKHRTAEIVDRERMWAIFGGIARKLQIEALAIGGTNDHVHLLMALPSTITLDEAVQKLKANSSRLARQTGTWSGWQEGYGAFSVSVSNVPQVKEYIRNQAEHHRRRDSREEFLEILRKAGVQFNPAEME